MFPEKTLETSALHWVQGLILCSVVGENLARNKVTLLNQINCLVGTLSLKELIIYLVHCIADTPV